MADVSLAPVVGFGAAVLQNLVPMVGLALGGALTYAAHRFAGVQISQALVTEVEKVIDDEALVLVKNGATKLETFTFHAGSDAVAEIVDRVISNFPMQLRKLGWSEPVLATKVAAELNRYAGALEKAPSVAVTKAA